MSNILEIKAEAEEVVTRLFILGYARFKSLPQTLQDSAVDMMAIIRYEDTDEDEKLRAMNTLRSILWDSDKIT